MNDKIKAPPPGDIIGHFIETGKITQEEYEKEFIEEWNKIFPNGIDNAIDKMYNMLKQSGHFEHFQEVAKRTLRIMYNE